jgi:hypothetical protein
MRQRLLHKGYLLSILVLMVWRNALGGTDSKLMAASALSARFESVFYLEADSLLDSGSASASGSHDSIRIPFVYFIGALKSLGDDVSRKTLENGQGVLVGASDFEAPAGLGTVRSRRCYILLLAPRSKFNLDNYFTGSPATSESGSPVWNWSSSLGEYGEMDSRSSSLYATQLGNSYVLVSNDRDEILNISRQLTSATAPEHMIGSDVWASVSQHEFWGYRRYRHGGIGDRRAAGASFLSPAAEALVFFGNFDNGAATLRLVTPAGDKTSVSTLRWAGLPQFKELGAGVWEAAIPLQKGGEQVTEQLFFVTSLFGFGVYL